MFFRVLLSGLVLIPFYELFLYLLMPGAKVPEWIDMRITKEYLAVGFGLALTVIVWIKEKKLYCPNKWALIFIGFLFFNLSKTPITVSSTIIDVSRIGSFPAEFKTLVFFLFFCAMTTANINKRQIRCILKTFYLCGAVMAAYMIIQALHLDQIYRPLKTVVRNPGVAGFFGQPTLVVPFLCMTIPMAIYFKKWIAVILMAVAAILTGSDFAIICLYLLILLYSFCNKRLLILAVILLLPGIFMFVKHPANYFQFSGRLEVWRHILQDVFTGQINNVTAHIGMTGAGLGNFGTVFTALHSSPWTTAHNEYLQMLWTCGIFGFAIFAMIHVDIFRIAWKHKKNIVSVTLAIALMMLIVCANGTFVYQLGAYQFLIIVLIGLLYQIEKKGVLI